MISDDNMLEVFAGIFESQQAAEEYMKIIDGKPQKLMDDLYLKGDFSGWIEIKYFDKKSNQVDQLFQDFPYGERIIEVLKTKFYDKLKRKVNTAIVIYDFNWSGHFSNHLLKQMSEKKTEQYYIFHVENVYPYR